MKLGLVLLRESEIVMGQRLNVSNLARRLRHTKEQAKIDRAYIDRLRGAVSFWVDRSERLEARLPPGTYYVRARGVTHVSYMLGKEIAAKFDSNGSRRTQAAEPPMPSREGKVL